MKSIINLERCFPTIKYKYSQYSIFKSILQKHKTKQKFVHVLNQVKLNMAENQTSV